METKVYNQKGKENGVIKLPKEIFGLPKNDALVHQVVVAMEANRRTPIAHTKNRGDVKGSGIKPWRQKGTGRARHGSRQSPIWVGGGVAHGPRNERDYSQKLNKKMKTKALFTALSQKFNDGQIIFVDSISLSKPKSKDAKDIINSLNKEFAGLSRRKNAAFLSIPNKDQNIEKSFSNFGNIEVGLLKDINILDVLNYKFLIVSNPDMAVSTLMSKNK